VETTVDKEPLKCLKFGHLLALGCGKQFPAKLSRLA
jgi:hypothetical protein